MGRYRHDVLRHSDRLYSKYTGQHCIAKNLIHFLERCHVLVPDRQFEDARKALLAEGYVDEPFTYLRWTDLGAPCCEMRAWIYTHTSLSNVPLILCFKAIHDLQKVPRSFSYSDCPLSNPCLAIWIYQTTKKLGGSRSPLCLPSRCPSCTRSVAQSQTPKAYASVRFSAACVITPSFVDTNLLVVTLWKVNRLKKS